ncbi:uncharacterized protein LOC142317759 [Lycorma delicatula]|uniref:uncharacterized protein LOC142317759 n=1 Tax=Lycorma delicatula TaxID=130591 RepID=UPI003F516C7D
MNDKKLTELMRAHLDSNKAYSKKFNSYIRKDYLWKEIESSLNQPGPACKNRWAFLRDQFKKTKRIPKGGQSAENSRKWKYVDQLSFLRSFICDRPSGTNINSHSRESDNKEQLNINFQPDSNNQCIISEEQNLNIDHSVGRNRKQSEKQRISDLRKVRKPYSLLKGSNKEVLCSALLKRYLMDKSKNKADPLECFFSGVSATVKQLSPYYQNIAKSRIFSIVTDLEMKQIMETKSNSNENLSVKQMNQDPTHPHEEQFSVNKYTTNDQPTQKLSTLNINVPSSLYNMQSKLTYNEFDNLSSFYPLHSSNTKLEGISV